MALDTRKLRNIVVPATLLFVFSVAGVTFQSDNRERARMEHKIRDLDSRLVQKRAIARDLDRYRAEVPRLRARLAEAKKILEPRFDVLGAKMAEHGILLSHDTGTLAGFHRRTSITLVGRSQVQLNAALLVLKDSGNVVAYSKIQLSEHDGSIDADTFSFVERGAPPPLEDEVPWYSWINDDRRSEIEEKQRELAKLDDLIGEIGEFAVLKRELEERLQVIKNVRKIANERELEVRSCFEASAIDDIAVLLEKNVVGREVVGPCTVARLSSAEQAERVEKK